MPDQRRSPRVPVTVSCLLTADIRPPWWVRAQLAAETVNVSQHGACLRLAVSAADLQLGDHAVLHLNHPMYERGLDIVVKVVWVKREQLGVEFLRVLRAPGPSDPRRRPPAPRGRSGEGESLLPSLK